MDRPRIRNCKFKIGNNVFIEFSGYNLDEYRGGKSIKLKGVYGSGPMYESTTEIELLDNDIDKNPDFYVYDRTAWGNCWHNLAVSKTTLFYNGKLLQCLDIPDGITSITPGLFALDYDKDVINPISVIRLGKSVKSIGYWAFKHEHVFFRSDPKPLGRDYDEETLHLDHLEHVIFTSDEPLDLVDDEAFKGCIRLTTVDFRGKTPKSFGDSVFKDCFNLHSVSFGKNANLNTHIFDNCVSLTSFNADNSLNEIYFETATELTHGLFNGCTSLNRLKFTNKSLFLTKTSMSFFKRTMIEDNEFIRNDKAFITTDIGSLNDYIDSLNGEEITEILSNYKPLRTHMCEPFDIFLRQYILNYKLPTIIESKNGGAFMHKWYTLENRYVAVKNGVPFLIVKHKGKLIRINMYPYPYYNMPTDIKHRPYIFIKHKDIMWCLVTSDDKGYCPVSIKHNNVLDYINNENIFEQES